MSNLGRFLQEDRGIFAAYTSSVGWIRYDRDRSAPGIDIDYKNVRKIIARYLLEPRVYHCELTFDLAYAARPYIGQDDNVLRTIFVKHHCQVAPLRVLRWLQTLPNEAMTLPKAFSKCCKTKLPSSCCACSYTRRSRRS